MFSSLPKIFDKTFVVAFLVPVLAFGLTLSLAFPDWPALRSIEAHLASDKGLGDLTMVLATTWFGALSLMLVNRPLYRAMEGYVGPLAHESFRTRMQTRWDRRMRELSIQLAVARKLSGDARKAAAVVYNKRRADMLRYFPRTRGRVLGSRFGNINRAFEDYPTSVHGVDGIAIWPRMSAIMPKDFQAILGDARAQVDCFLNLTVLAAVFVVVELCRWAWSLTLVVALSSTPPTTHGLARLVGRPGSCVRWDALFLALAAAIFLRLTYWLMLDRAVALGEQVKTAFDLHLGPLLTQLGYELPTAAADQRKLWKALRGSYVYFDPAPQAHRLKRPPAPPSSDPPPAGAAGAPPEDRGGGETGDQEE